MTRINVGVHPYELPNKLLLAEHREITRIPNAIISGKAKIVNIPKKFTLGKGHVKFFYNKLLFLEKRYKQIYEECRKRQFNIQNKKNSFLGPFDINLLNDYDPCQADRDLIVERIMSKGFYLLQD